MLYEFTQRLDDHLSGTRKGRVETQRVARAGRLHHLWGPVQNENIGHSRPEIIKNVKMATVECLIFMHDAMRKGDRHQSRKEYLYVFGGERCRLDDYGENHIISLIINFHVLKRFSVNGL